MTMLEMLQFLKLITTHHLMQIILRIFLILGEGDTFGINGNFGAAGISLVLILVKQTQNFAAVYITMLIIVIYLLMGKKCLKFIN